MSGRELADEVHRRRPGIRVLFISGYSADAVERRGWRVPGDAFLQKPYTPDTLARMLRKVMQPAALVSA